MEWTSESVDLLKEKWAAGLTATQIAAEMPGFTRNAVIGKAHRLDLPMRISPKSTKEKPAQPIRLKPTKRTKPMPKKIIGPPTEDESKWIPFMASTKDTCRAILGRSKEDGLVLWCPNEKDDAPGPVPTYCAYHSGIYYNKSSR